MMNLRIQRAAGVVLGLCGTCGLGVAQQDVDGQMHAQVVQMTGAGVYGVAGLRLRANRMHAFRDAPGYKNQTCGSNRMHAFRDAPGYKNQTSGSNRMHSFRDAAGYEHLHSKHRRFETVKYEEYKRMNIQQQKDYVTERSLDELPNVGMKDLKRKLMGEESLVGAFRR